MKLMDWPKNKDFAFTIIDDTDNATCLNIKPIYDLLFQLGIRSTKTVWVYPSRDRFTGDSLSNNKYLDFILDLQEKGFEIAFHGVGSGYFNRTEILKGLDYYKSMLGEYPKMHINHAQNPNNLYWGNRFGSKLLQTYSQWRNPNEKFYGDISNSEHYWGDFSKKHIKYIRGRTFNNINTLLKDPKMPYKDRDKEESSNFWFSSSDGADVNLFTKLIQQNNVDTLIKQRGLCIVYTHFASGFVNSEGHINKQFRKNIEYLTSMDGWFANASEILNYLHSNKNKDYENELYFSLLDIKQIISKKLANKFGNLH